MKYGDNKTATIVLSTKTTNGTERPKRAGRSTIPSTPHKLAAIITNRGAKLSFVDE
jgi:hypothetical protein